MALIHRTKVTHSYEASPQHFQKFFSTLTQMYEEQVHTDVHLVAKDGTLFGVHRVRNKYNTKLRTYIRMYNSHCHGEEQHDCAQ